MLVMAPVNDLLCFLWRTVTLEDCDLLASPLGWPFVEPTLAEPFRYPLALGFEPFLARPLLCGAAMVAVLRPVDGQRLLACCGPVYRWRCGRSATIGTCNGRQREMRESEEAAARTMNVLKSSEY